MAIEFSCPCGKQIRVAKKFAGRRAKCPACGGPLTIPQPAPTEDQIDGDLLYEAVGSEYETVAEQPAASNNVCGGCGKPMPANAVLCTHCGYHRISGTYVKVADVDAANQKQPRAALFSISGLGVRAWVMLVLLALLIGVPVWYVTGPGRALQILQQQTVSVIPTIKSGETREPFSLFTQQGDMSLGLKGTPSKSNPNAPVSNTEVYSMGGDDELIVTMPDDKGDHVLLRVALKQDAIRAAGRTSGYDSVIAAKDFKLVPDDGGPPIDAKLLYVDFDSGSAQIDLHGADTSNYKTLFPTLPTQLDVNEQGGTVTGKAVWNQHNAKGEISFMSFRSTGDAPAPKGLSADGRVTLYNDSGETAELLYNSDSLKVTWDSDATGWWSKRRFKKMSQDWPWYRYHVGLLFARPQAQGKYTLTYCDQPVGSVFLEEKPVPKPPPTSPIKRAQGIGQPAAKTSNSPLAYFDILIDARGQAKGIVSAQNLRQIGIGLRLYLDNNQNQWPDRLDQLATVIDGFDQLMVNPRTGDHPGFIYTKPDPGADPATTAVVHESWQGRPDPNGAVLYADGSIR